MDAFPFSKGFVIMAANVITSFLGASSISALYVCTFSLVLHPFGMSPRDIPHLLTHRITEAVAAEAADAAATFYILVQHPSLLALMRPPQEPHATREWATH